MIYISVLFVFIINAQCQSVPLRGPPQFERNPLYSSSYVPATMQIIAHFTEIMKFELRPGGGSSTTSTTVRPTPPHKPGVFAPSSPLGPSFYFSKRSSSQDGYIQEIMSGVDSGLIAKFLRNFEPNLQESHVQDLDLFGKGPSDLHKAVNGLDEDDYVGDDDDVRVTKFIEKFDESILSEQLIRQRKTPPTRAYVTLLGIYDLLNKESKKLGLNKYNGYSMYILNDLKEISTGSSSYQLKYVLMKIVEKKQATDPMLLNKIATMIQDLSKDDSYINVALRYIPPLPFDY